MFPSKQDLEADAMCNFVDICVLEMNHMQKHTLLALVHSKRKKRLKTGNKNQQIISNIPKAKKRLPRFGELVAAGSFVASADEEKAVFKLALLDERRKAAAMLAGGAAIPLKLEAAYVLGLTAEC